MVRHLPQVRLHFRLHEVGKVGKYVVQLIIVVLVCRVDVRDESLVFVLGYGNFKLFPKLNYPVRGPV